MPDSDDTFTIIDASDVSVFDPIVDVGRVEGVIDHHPGFEEIWHDKLGDAAVIEFIGAACTLVYEAWNHSGLLEKMSETSARLLIAGILDNTLHFKASVTTDRDRDAYSELCKIADLPPDWPAQYFTECQAVIETDLEETLTIGTKHLTDERLPPYFAQLAVWDGRGLLKARLKEIEAILTYIAPDHALNLISISEGKSYFLVADPRVQKLLSDTIGIVFANNLAVASRLWLRKEVSKAAGL